METGVITLINTKQYPFNNSSRTVALVFEQDKADYFVLTEVTGSDGNVGELLVCDKAENGFRIAFTGSAKHVDIRYTVLKEASDGNCV